MDREKMLDKIAGCLLGMAVGDAMGMPGLFSAQATQELHGGLLTDFVDASKDPEIDEVHYGLPAGMVTDDTLAGFSIVKSYIANGLDAQAFANGYVEWVKESDKQMEAMNRRSLAGPNTQIALKRIRDGESIWETGKFGTTNGACMRIAPVGFLYPGNYEKTVDAVYQTCISTHNTNVAISAAGAIACAVSACAAGEAQIPKIVNAAIEGARLGEQKGRKVYCPSIPRRCEVAIQIAQSDLPEEKRRQELYDILGNDMPSYEIVPVCMGVLYLSGGDFIKGIRQAINVGGDNDTQGCITGGILGALNGFRKIPTQYYEKIEQVNHLGILETAEAYLQAMEGNAK